MSNEYSKLERLRQILAKTGRLVVAFSGGVDSVFLLRVAREVLPQGNLLALTARSPFFPGWETTQAAELAQSLNVPQVMMDIDLLAINAIAANPPDRCYFCKRTVMSAIIAEARSRGFEQVADGGNLDDLSDYRPGLRAVRELGVISPLKTAGLSKAEVRAFSAELGLPTWNKPAFACLASRFPYGQLLTLESLTRVEKAEDFLLGLGFREVRARCHGRMARLEVGVEERPRFFDLQLMNLVHRELLSLGFSFVALDLAGYRTGSLNSELDEINKVNG